MIDRGELMGALFGALVAGAVTWLIFGSGAVAVNGALAYMAGWGLRQLVENR